MLDVDRDFECPRMGPPALPPVDARALLPAWRTLSVLIWRWNRDPEAARESMGISSLTWTVWACCRRLSRREKRREQWHWKGRSPVCFLFKMLDICGGHKIRSGWFSPDMPGQMFTSCEAEVARWVICAVKSLGLLLLPRLRVAFLVTSDIFVV